jgi:hypothetical protein
VGFYDKLDGGDHGPVCQGAAGTIVVASCRNSGACGHAAANSRGGFNDASTELEKTQADGGAPWGSRPALSV